MSLSFGTALLDTIPIANVYQLYGRLYIKVVFAH